MTVNERATSLQKALGTYQQLVVMKAEAKQYEQRRVELHERRSKLTAQVAAADALTQATLLSTDPLPRSEAVQSLVSAVRARFVEAPTEIRRGQDYADMLQQIDLFVSQVELLTGAAWKKFKQDNDPTGGGTLQQLKKLPVPGIRQKVEAVQLLCDRLQGLSLPQSAAEVQSARQIVDRLTKLFGAIDFGDIPESVTRLFRAASARQGASLALLTKEVNTWLGENDMDGAVRITLAHEE